jgi:hypothetical protein
MLCSLPLALSLADTLTMPLASISKVTSICGIPRGAGGIPTRSNEQLVVSRHLSLALEDADGDRGLILLGCRENLALLRRDGGVTVDQLGHYAAKRLDAERQRGNVEQQNILDVALQHACLDCCTDGDHFVRIDALVRLALEQLLHGLLDLRHAGLSADQHDLVDVGRLQARVLQCGFAGLDGALDQVIDQRLQLGARQLDGEMLRPVLIRGNERQIDVGLGGARELDLCLLGRILEPLQRKAVLAQVDAILLAEFVGQIVDDPLVEIFAAEERVAVRRFDLEDAVAYLEYRNVERASAKVVDGDLAATLLFEPVGERGGGGLVDDAQHLEAGDPPGVLCRLTLGFVEIGRHGDHRLRHGAAEIGFRRFLHLGEDEGADLAWAVFLAPDLDPGVAIVAGTIS